MKKRPALLIVLLLTGSLARAQSATSLSFTVSVDTPAAQVFHVVMRCEGIKKDTIEFKMPVWMPGYYVVLNYADNVFHFTAFTKAGKPLSWEKSAKNGWKVQTGKAASVVISYDIKATRPFVATSYLDEERGYIAPPGVFMHPAGMIKQPVELRIKPYAKWTAIATGLAPVKNKPNTFYAPDFDVLYDSPVLMGNLDSFPSFTVHGIPHYFVAYKPGHFDRDTFMADMKKIVAAASAIIGDIPYRFYIFLGIPGPGGIEHLNSAAVAFSGNELNSRQGKINTYSFLAHEYFHHYNVKRIRPVELGPFDYNNGSKTKMLWLSEGVTVYYEYIILKRAGFLTQNELLNLFSQSIRAYESKPGRWVQTPAQASYSTWEDGPFGGTGERANKTISPYDKGPLLGLLLDVKIRHETANRKSLDNLMKLLYNKYYKQAGRGFTEQEFRAEAEKMAGTSLADFFDYIYTLKQVDYPTYLNYAGLGIDTTAETSTGHKYAIAPVANPGSLQAVILKSWLGVAK